MRRPHLWRVAALFLLAVPAAGATASAASDEGAAPVDRSGFSTNSSSWEGLSEFVRLAQKRWGKEAVHIRASLNYGEFEPNDALIVLHPESNLDGDALTLFLAAGGRVAIIDDFGAAPEFLSRFSGLRRVPPPAEPTLRVAGKRALAIAVPVVQHGPGGERGRHPMTEHVDVVVTNHASAFEHPDLTPLLEIEGEDGRSLPIAVTGVIAERGRLVAIGDPSIFINLMLRYPGNRAFAAGLVDYLRAGASPGRLWIATGPFEQRGHYGETNFRTELRDRLAASERALAELNREGLPPLLALVLAICIAVGVARFEIGDQLRVPRFVQPSFARVPRVAAQSGVSARAEVLAAPSTPAVLVVLELAAALDATLERRWGVPAHESPERLRAAAQRAGLDPEATRQLVRLVTDLRAWEGKVAAGKTPRLSEGELKRIHRDVMNTISAMTPPTETPRQGKIS